MFIYICASFLISLYALLTRFTVRIISEFCLLSNIKGFYPLSFIVIILLLLTSLQNFMKTVLFYFCFDFQSVFKWVCVYHRSLVIKAFILEPAFDPQRNSLFQYF
jgi:hypothetical protein